MSDKNKVVGPTKNIINPKTKESIRLLKIQSKKSGNKEESFLRQDEENKSNRYFEPNKNKYRTPQTTQKKEIKNQFFKEINVSTPTYTYF